MSLVRDAAYTAFVGALDQDTTAIRIKDVRDAALTPGGRTRMTLFERPVDQSRPHPRLRTDMPPAADPTTPPSPLFTTSATTAAAFRAELTAALGTHRAWLGVEDLDASKAPRGSERFYRNSVRVQRVARLFGDAETALRASAQAGHLMGGEATGAWRALRELRDEAYAANLQFDNANTGTYHSFQHDKPFVHYMEAMLASLPQDGSPAFQVLPPEQQESLVRQRKQLLAHLDHIMRHKYANHGITETDIERTLGGFLIDRETRQILSETAASKSSLVPAYELLRVDPGANHPNKGAYVYRGSNGELHLADGKPVTVDAAAIRSIPIPTERVTFRRAPEDVNLRQGVRLDWDRNGYVSPRPVGWVSWAGHCDIKAIMEQLGLALVDTPSLTELRTDTGATQVYNRDLLIEMIASVFELGSVYARLDGSGKVVRGVHRFGGARNDSLPDRIQFKGLSSGKGFRWPLGGRQDTWRVVRAEEAGQPVDLERSFYRYTADMTKLDFAPNPRFRETVEGDYNVIDVTGMVLSIDAQIDDIDPNTGYPTQSRQTLTLDLRPTATEERTFLGTSLRDAARREIWRVYLNRRNHQIEADSVTYTAQNGKWVSQTSATPAMTVPLAMPITCTLSREMRKDDPALFQSLLDVALKQGQNINADTSDEAEVWNGTVVSLGAQKRKSNPDTRVEWWTVNLEARFGSAQLDYLLRRKEDGTPDAWCPAPSDGFTKAPDFLWQDFPDVGSKGVEGADWVVNATMWERGIVDVRTALQAQGGAYIYDDHVKNLFEMIFCALGGYSWTIVHMNKRYGFKDEASYKTAAERLSTLRRALRFEGGLVA